MPRTDITMGGNPLTLIGEGLAAGQKAPDFTLTDNKLQPVSLSDFKGKTVILSVVPSIDTPTCSIETHRFNAEAAKLDDNTIVLTVSKDLPFAQARWCAAQGVEKVVMLSDYKCSDFGKNYGVLIEGLGLLTRAIYIIDAQGIVRYEQFVKEVSKEPDYEAVLKAAKDAAKK